MEKHWIDTLRKRFADRQVAPPEGLWDGVEAALARSRSRRRARYLLLWRAAAVAACVAVVVVAGWRFIGHDSRDGRRLPFSAERAVHGNEPQYAQDVESVGSGVCHDMMSRIAEEVYGGDDSNCIAAADTAALLADADTLRVSDTRPTVDLSGAKHSSAPAERTVRRTADGVRGGHGNLLALADVGSNGGARGVSVSVYGTGLSAFGSGDGRSSSSFMPYYVVQDAAPDADFRLLSAAYANTTEAAEVNVKHRQPVRLGASVRFRLTDRLGIETGANYSYHSSDIASGDEKAGYKTEQKLHFVGVPLNVSYNVWRNDYLEVYFSAGGAVDFCVSGDSHTEFVSGGAVVRTEDDDVRDSRPQWSVNASAGVQYDFIPSLGVYLEPGVSYYFDNGSNVETIYKDKPFNFNLNVGLRLTFGK